MHTRFLEPTLGSFPAEVKAPVQYGPTLQAVANYLHQGQLLPTSRTCETLTALCGCHLSEATVIQWGELAAERLGPTMGRLADLLVASPLQHGDETGIRIYGMLHWVHVNCTRFLTHLAWHEARGKVDMQEIGIWSRFSGRGMMTGWSVMMPMEALIAFVVCICCEIVSPLPSRNTNLGPWRCTIFCSICMKPVNSGVNANR